MVRHLLGVGPWDVGTLMTTDRLHEKAKTMTTQAKSKTSITFDCTLISPLALRQMAKDAIARRDQLDGVSAAHYLAWNNLAAALQAKADEILSEDQTITIEVTEIAAEQLASHRLSPRFFHIDGCVVSAKREIWTQIAAMADEQCTKLPKLLAGVWGNLHTPQQRHVARKAKEALLYA